HNSFNPNNYDNSNAKAAIFTFSGDVYKGLEADTLDNKTIEYAQNPLLMLSGLYGLVRPLDLILAYRLDMGTNIKIDGKILHKY
ncbi:peroxide stress protein YaaA, partial [Francisella tularensis subsp. holarctica]|uniref:peroxide stress protein YaaA n=1 Tax=Francisella tularensis TaxID=263 RepID=UPI002381BDF9